ncbi:MAG: histidinol-phosphatase HisJ family protein [Ruminococcaceae bacterium]|nr:histidinol-phosphatase HisJ family protein [Oscillospiraceae bacterium]
MIPRCNLHTHTTFCDGKSTATEMVVSAIQLGCTTLGFSGHAPASELAGQELWCMDPNTLQAYWNEIGRLKQAYRDSIEILCGVEMDYYSDPLPVKPEYIIGSVHQIKKNGMEFAIDLAPEELSRGIQLLFDGDVWSFVKRYYEMVSEIVSKTKCDIVGHFDLLTKYNEYSRYLDESDPRYISLAYEALDSLLEQDTLIEINTGAISRGWKKAPYPAPFILKRIAQKNGRVILNSDAHHAQALLCHFAESVELARTCGIRELWVVQNGQFAPISI